MDILCSVADQIILQFSAERIVDKVVNSGEKTNTFPAKDNRNKNHNNKISNVKRKDGDESDGEDKKSKKTKINVARNEVESEDDDLDPHVCVT